MNDVGKGKRPARDRARSLVERAYESLEEMIVTLELEPGTVLSEQALSERLGIGRTPIREALQRLAREGLVLILPRKGILVSDLNPRKQLLLLEVRRVLERLTARRSAERCTEAERVGFEAIADGMEAAAEANDEVGFIRYDKELNELIAASAHNEYALRAAELMHGLSRRFWYQHYRTAADLPMCARLHAELARRIAARDADGAGAASDKLIDYVEAFTRQTVLGG